MNVKNPFYNSTRCSQCTGFRHRSLSVTFRNLFERLSHNPILSTIQYSGTLHIILRIFIKNVLHNSTLYSIQNYPSLAYPYKRYLLMHEDPSVHPSYHVHFTAGLVMMPILTLGSFFLPHLSFK